MRGISAAIGGVAASTTGTAAVDEEADGRSTREHRRGRESGLGAETGTEGSFVAEAEPARARALLLGFEDDLGAGGRSCVDTFAGSSDTLGNPE